MDNEDALLHPIQTNAKTYFVQSRYINNKSCAILVTDAKKVWKCELDEAAIASFAEDTSSGFEEYFMLMKSALSGVPVLQKFHYEIVEEYGGNLTFEWKRVNNDIKFCLGKIQLEKSPCVDTDVTAMLLTCSDALKSVRSQLEEREQAYHQLQKEHSILLSDLQKCVELKDNLQTELLTKFVVVINEKKAKIRSLKEQLSSSNRQNLKADETAIKHQEPMLTDPSDRFPSNPKMSRPAFDDDLGGPLLPKRKRRIANQPVKVSVSPVKKEKEQRHPVSPVKFPSDLNATTSSDETVDVNELLDII